MILKPCPFCGAPADVEYWYGGGSRKRMVSCSNSSCFVAPQVTGSTQVQAIERWNTRTTLGKEKK